MDLEILLKAIVPLAFLAIWALTAVFNKEGNSLPARNPSPPQPLRPAPGHPAAGRPAERTAAGAPVVGDEHGAACAEARGRG